MEGEEARVRNCRKFLKQRLPQRDICHRLGMSASTVSAIKNCEDRPFKFKKPGRKPCITPEMSNYIEMTLSADALVPDDEMTRRLNQKFGTSVSVSSVCRARQALKFVYRPPKICQDLTEDQIALRLEFCRWVLSNREELRNLIFSDESRFERTPDNTWRRIRRGTYNDTCFYKKSKFPPGTMVWGAIGVGFRTDLIECSHGVNSGEYISIIEKSGMVQELNRKYGRGNWIFMQDGAPAHNAKETLDYLSSQKVKVMPGWPPNSPDLNPIEMLWGVLKKQLRKRAIESNNWFLLLKESWQLIGEEVIDSLVRSFFDRCQLVLQLAGASATPYLSAHRTDTPPIALPAPLWTPEEDDRLRELREEHGRKFGVISRLLEKKQQIVRNRAKMQDQMIRNLLCDPPPPLPSVSEFVTKVPDGGIDVFLDQILQRRVMLSIAK